MGAAGARRWHVMGTADSLTLASAIAIVEDVYAHVGLGKWRRFKHEQLCVMPQGEGGATFLCWRASVITSSLKAPC